MDHNGRYCTAEGCDDTVGDCEHKKSYKCANCDGSHPADSGDCPAWAKKRGAINEREAKLKAAKKKGALTGDPQGETPATTDAAAPKKTRTNGSRDARSKGENARRMAQKQLEEQIADDNTTQHETSPAETRQEHNRNDNDEVMTEQTEGGNPENPSTSH